MGHNERYGPPNKRKPKDVSAQSGKVSLGLGLVAAREIKYCCQGFGREVEDNSSIGRIAQHMRAAPGPGVVSSPTLSRYVTKRELRVT